MSRRRLPGIGIMVLLTVMLAAANAPKPLRPPCGNPPMPDYPVAVGSPAVQSQTATGWTPPSCVGWDGAASTLLVAVAGRRYEPNEQDALLTRFGAVSTLRGARYWSVTEHAWQVLIRDAFAVTDAAGTSPRADFRPEEVKPGATLYSAERDSRSSRLVVYSMRTIVRTPDRLVVTVANASPVRLSMVTLFAPGDLQTTYFSTDWDRTTGAITDSGASQQAC